MLPGAASCDSRMLPGAASGPHRAAMYTWHVTWHVTWHKFFEGFQANFSNSHEPEQGRARTACTTAVLVFQRANARRSSFNKQFQ